jgi:hypothetical protein
VICVFQVCQVPINTLFPALEELQGHAGYPSASTRRTMAGLKKFEGYSSFTHPLVHLATLEKAEDVRLICRNTLGQYDFPLPTRSHLTRLDIEIPKYRMNQNDFQNIFGSFPNIKDITLDLRGVKGFNERVQQSLF